MTLESRWALVSGSPVSFVAPQKVRGNTRHVFKGQPSPDDLAPVLTKQSALLPSHLIISAATFLGDRPGRSEVVESPASCAKWQWFELKVT